MFKFIYIINTPGYTPETYNGTYADENSITWVVGTDGIDCAVEYVKKMAEEGFKVINLCGDFDDEMTAQIQAAAGNDAKVRHANYAFGEEKKIENLELFEKYGIIAVTPGIKEPVAIEINSPELFTKMWLVADQQQANEVAVLLAKEGMHDIELCSWFTEERTLPIIDVVNSSTIPVGTCGI